MKVLQQSKEKKRIMFALFFLITATAKNDPNAHMSSFNQHHQFQS